MRINALLFVRYWLEIIVLPIFVFLVIHLAGEGFWRFFEIEPHDSLEDHFVLTSLLNKELIVGLFLLLFFVVLWRKTFLKKWVPCAHEHCHHEENKFSHVLAMVVLCVHFIPEAGIRYALLMNLYGDGVLNVLVGVGFVVHFFLDVIVMLFLSLHWKRRMYSVLSFLSLFMCWLLALYFGEMIMISISSAFEGVLLLVSAFLLAMFIHCPHKPVLDCRDCC